MNGKSERGSDRVETWSEGWPSSPQGVVYRARCLRCTQTYSSGDREQAFVDAKNCCAGEKLVTDGGHPASGTDQFGGEPFWVVVAKLEGDEIASATVDAPTEEEAEAEGQRVIASQAPETIERVARTTGPFPSFVQTEERERRPKVCHGCGLRRYCGNHPPAPYQTWFELIGGPRESNYWQCINCGTGTRMPAVLGGATDDA